jgi:AcrR family transcriptional regulator
VSQALSEQRILEAALQLIDSQGLAAFSIRTLADKLSVAPAAIYWHVPNRDALIAGAMALALQDVGRDLSRASWQESLRALLKGFRDALREHPQLAPVVASQLTYNAAFNAALLDHIVSALKAARFEGADLVDAFNVVVAAMCGYATLELSTLPEERLDAWKSACLTRIDGIDAKQFPALHAHRNALRNRAFLLRWSGGIEQPLDTGFAAWVDVLVRGLESRSRALRR